MTDIVGMDANVSSRVDLLRIVLVCGIVFVHVPFDRQTSAFPGAYGFLDWLLFHPGEGLLWSGSRFADYPLSDFTMPILMIAVLVACHDLVKRLATDLLGVLAGSRSGSGRMALPAQDGGHASYSPQQR
ncbi:hypothetical protein [Sinorhizobium psoraleae]|uniref:hypothetical protein n=1 Tax=Sinorhizobium psoraleae TaxID=520838 RepID=UPI00156A0972|nr:hypothetical protein [Sinorhizobium psoraleae]